MGFYSYKGVPDKVLDEQHTTSEGKAYTLRHNENLKVEMPYVGKGKTNANSQGWERNSNTYFKQLQQEHPEMFSKKNAARVREGDAPIVDKKMIESNPGWAQYRNQPLIHHHIGGDGEAVAVPQEMHKGSGEIHNHEKAAGITENCRSFSRKCADRPDAEGKKSSQLHREMGERAPRSSKANVNHAAVSGDSQAAAKSSNSAKTRSEAVRSGGTSAKQTAPQKSRTQAVRSGGQSSGSSPSTGRAASVRNSSQSSRSGHSSAQHSSGSSQSRGR